MTTDLNAEVSRGAGVEIEVNVQGQDAAIRRDAHPVARQKGVAGTCHHHVFVTLQLTAHRSLHSDTQKPGIRR